MKKLTLIATLVIALALMVGPAYAVVCESTSPYDCSLYGGDADGDELCTDFETGVYLTDPNDADSDNGGVCDGDEVWAQGTQPTVGSDDLI